MTTYGHLSPYGTAPSLFVDPSTTMATRPQRGQLTYDPTAYADELDPGPGRQAGAELSFRSMPVQLAGQTERAVEATARTTRRAPVGRGLDPQRVAMANAQRKQIRTAAGIGAAGQALQAGVSFIPTGADRENNQALARLEARRKAGTTGKDARRDAIMDRELMSPVRALATESRQRTEARLAASGANKSAGDIQRARETEQRVVAEGARGAGLQKAKARSVRIDQELQELQNRLNFKGQQQRARIDAVGSALGAVGSAAGTIAAYQALPTPDTAGMQSVFMPNEDQIELMDAVGDTPMRRQGGFLGLLMGSPKQRS